MCLYIQLLLFALLFWLEPLIQVWLPQATASYMRAGTKLNKSDFLTVLMPVPAECLKLLDSY